MKLLVPIQASSYYQEDYRALHVKCKMRGQRYGEFVQMTREIFCVPPCSKNILQEIAPHLDQWFQSYGP